jgi:hypothetical protein
MEPIRTTKTARLRKLEMYREDLDEFVGFFQSSCDSVRISDSKNRYVSLDEMQLHSGSKIKDLDIRGDSPAVHFLLNRNEVVQGSSAPAIINELRTEEITDEADLLFLKIKEFLEERQRPKVRVPFLVIGVLSCAGLLASALSHLYHPLSQKASFGMLISVLLFIVSIPGATAIDNRITLEKRANSPSFWVRNREDFAKQAVTAGISALMGGFVGWLIGHFHK